MFRANEQHTGVYDEGGVRPNNELKWSFTTAPFPNVLSSPAVANGVVYVGSNDYKVYALDATDGTKLWEFAAGGRVDSSPAVANGVVYFGSWTDGKVYALDAQTGTKLWEFTTGGGVYSSPAVANGVVYIGSTDGKVYALDANTGAKVWEFTTGNDITSSPAVANGIVYIGSFDHKLYALNAQTGDKLWEFTTGNVVYSSPAVANGIVYVGSVDNKVYALDAQTGAKVWEFTTGLYVYSSPAVANGVVYVGSLDGKVYALDAQTGAKLWEFTTEGWIYSSPAVANGVVYVGSVDNKVYALDAQTGDKLWEFTTGGWIYFSSPAVANGVVYVGSNDGKVYAIGNEPTPPTNQPPVANAGPDQTVHVGTQVTLNGIGSSDPDNNLPLTYAWSIQSTPAGSTVALSDKTVAQPTFTPDKLGDYVFALTVKDSLGLQSTTPATVTITATNQPPDVSNAKPSVSCLWPPNNKLVDVTINGVTDPNGDKVTISITKITSDEATATAPGAGGATHSPDAFIIHNAGVDDTAQLRAERSGTGNGRVYVISFTATDVYGAATQGTVKVVVPHDQSTPCTAIDDGQLYDATAIN
jgi:outer membrane protein assembly factor BamB